MKTYHASVAIIFNSNNKILLSKRYEPRHKPSHNKWQFPGGGIEKGETPQQTVIREVKEEASIEIELLSTNPIERIEGANPVKTVFVHLYAFPAQYVSGTISCENDPESSEINWFEYKDIDFTNTLPGTKELIDEVLTKWKKH